MATATLPRITARVDSDTQSLLSQAAAVMGMTSMNAFVLNAAIEKAKLILLQEKALSLSLRDAQTLVNALDAPAQTHDRLQKSSQTLSSAKQLMISVKLDKSRHHREAFDCGVAALNHYLLMMANQQSSKDNARTYVLTNESDDREIIGFYTLTMGTLNLSALPENLQKKHRNASSAGLIARLAVDKKFAKQGYGEWLLINALHRLLDASETVGFPLVLVDAKDGVAGFYERFGFKSFADEANKLFMTIADIRANIT